MGILKLLGLGDKKKEDSSQSGQKSDPAHAENTCCGSCGGHGHVDRKGKQS